MACVEGRIKHSYQGGDKCVHCGEPNPSEAPSGAPGGLPTGGVTGESLTDLEKQAAGGSTKETKYTKRQASKVEDEKKLSETRSIRAKTMARMPSQFMRTAAALQYGYHGNAFTLTESELSELSSCYESVGEAFGWEFAGKWMSLIFLMYVQGNVCFRQWMEMTADTSVVREDATK